MKITALAAKPKLVQVSLNDEEIIKQYNEAIDFYTWDRQPLDVFMQLASATEGKTKDIITIVKDLILNEDGEPILVDGAMLPTNVLMKAIGEVVSLLGK